MRNTSIGPRVLMVFQWFNLLNTNCVSNPTHWKKEERAMKQDFFEDPTYKYDTFDYFTCDNLFIFFSTPRKEIWNRSEKWEKDEDLVMHDVTAHWSLLIGYFLGNSCIGTPTSFINFFCTGVLDIVRYFQVLSSACFLKFWNPASTYVANTFYITRKKSTFDRLKWYVCRRHRSKLTWHTLKKRRGWH